MPSVSKADAFLLVLVVTSSILTLATTTAVVAASSATTGGDTNDLSLVRKIKNSKKTNVNKHNDNTCSMEPFLGTSMYTNCKKEETEVKIACAKQGIAVADGTPTKKMCSYSEQPVLFDEDEAAAAEATAGCGDHGFFDPETHLTRDHATGVCRLKFLRLTSTCVGAPASSGFGVMVEVPPRTGTGTGTGPGAHTHHEPNEDKNLKDNSGLLLRFSYDAGTTYDNYKNPRLTVPLNRSSPRRHCAAASEKVVYLVRHGEKVWVPPNETAYAYACLSEQGWARAYHLQGVFGPTTTTTTTSTPVFQTPEAIFSYNYHNAQTCRTSRGFYRTQATAAPLAALLDLHIDNSTGSNPELCGMSVKEGDDIDNGSGRSSGQCVQTTGLVSFVGFGPCCNVAAAAKIKNTLLIGNHLNQTVNAIVVAWEHFNLAYLAKALGANNCDDQTLSPGCNMTWPSNEFDYIWALYFDAHTGAYLCIDTTLRQGFEWIGPTTPGLQIYNRGPGEHPGID